MAPDAAVSFLETRIGSHVTCSGGSSSDRAMALYGSGVPCPFDVLAWPRPAGRTETLTEAITPTSDEKEEDTKTWVEVNQEGLCGISTTSRNSSISRARVA